MALGTFPFGQPVKCVAQADRGPKRVFVLGVYASAVHACWRDANGVLLVRALGVASEPCIFWRGEGVEDIISTIDVPLEAGRLLPADDCFNGPSGRSIDDDFLEPLGLTREDAWLSDLVPHSCMNECQAAAVSRCYAPLVERLGLPPVDWPLLPAMPTDAARREQIAVELRDSEAELLVTLGNQPLGWFAAKVFSGPSSLAAYGTDARTYGMVHDVEFGARPLGLLPLVHPRQAAGLGTHSPFWNRLHRAWVRQVAPVVRTRL